VIPAQPHDLTTPVDDHPLVWWVTQWKLRGVWRCFAGAPVCHATEEEALAQVERVRAWYLRAEAVRVGKCSVVWEELKT